MPAAVLALSVITACSTAVEESRAFAHLSFDDALAAAKKDNKVVMVDFFTTWCPPCKKLDQVTWQDPRVIAWLGEKSVALKIDAEKETALAARFGVNAYPTMVFVEPDGREIGRVMGYLPPAQFLDQAAKVIAKRGGASKPE